MTVTAPATVCSESTPICATGDTGKAGVDVDPQRFAWDQSKTLKRQRWSTQETCRPTVRASQHRAGCTDAAAKPLVDAGRVKLLAVTSEKRDPRFPSTPTAVEAGVKGFVQQSWVGLLAPAATPAATLERLNKAAAAAVADPGVQKRFGELGLQAQGGPASRLAGMIGDELTLYRKIAVDAKLQFE